MQLIRVRIDIVQLRSHCFQSRKQLECQQNGNWMRSDGEKNTLNTITGIKICLISQQIHLLPIWSEHSTTNTPYRHRRNHVGNGPRQIARCIYFWSYSNICTALALSFAACVTAASQQLVARRKMYRSTYGWITLSPSYAMCVPGRAVFQRRAYIFLFMSYKLNWWQVVLAILRIVHRHCRVFSKTVFTRQNSMQTGPIRGKRVHFRHSYARLRNFEITTENVETHRHTHTDTLERRMHCRIKSTWLTWRRSEV